jgi:hypothetical protein
VRIILPVTVASRLSFLPSSGTVSSVAGATFGFNGRAREPEPEVVALDWRDDDPDWLSPPRMPKTLPEKEGGGLAPGERITGDVFDLFRLGALEPSALRLLPERASVLVDLDFLSGIVPMGVSPVIGSEFSFSLLGRGVATTLFPFEGRGISPVKEEKTSKSSFDG